MAELTRDWGVKPELEVFDLGHIRFARQMISEGLIAAPPMFQICLGIPWGADQSVDTMKVMKDHLPADASWASFGISRMRASIVSKSEGLKVRGLRGSGGQPLPGQGGTGVQRSVG